ncbi:hypothetical protein [Tenacibaculum singaporense]|uniref:hypothetical protein n=1 Tax=Tenacibaculum singaporense TaxID=2358479 RepID=UPI000F665779|nr:hypothetical protein [Tenacibaculum singaporense]RSC96044.1 hypothetical protein EI424_02685 [Tenacibaculum singaporense]
MANSTPIEIFKEVLKTDKKRNATAMQKVMYKNIDETVKSLQKNGVRLFEVVDKDNNIKTQYIKCLGGKNYEKKVVKL